MVQIQSPQPVITADIVEKAKSIILEHKRGSISLVQRVMKIRYYEAALILEELERQGVVGPMTGSGGRDVLIQSS